MITRSLVMNDLIKFELTQEELNEFNINAIEKELISKGIEISGPVIL